MESKVARPLKTAGRRAAAVGGLSIARKGAIGRTMGDALGHLRRVWGEPASIIDVGVAAGTPDLYATFPASRYLLVEPLREWESDLRKLCRKLDAVYVLAVAGAQNGTASVRVHADLSGSSIHQETDLSDAAAEEREVPMLTLDRLAETHQLTPPFLVKADVQGAELEVMAGASNILAQDTVVILEVSTFNFVSGAPDLFEVVSTMKQAGFVLYDICGGHFRPFDGALAQLDIVFVRDKGPLRVYHGYRRRSRET